MKKWSKNNHKPHFFNISINLHFLDLEALSSSSKHANNPPQNNQKCETMVHPYISNELGIRQIQYISH